MTLAYFTVREIYQMCFTRSIELESSEEQLVDDEEGLAAYLADAIVVPLHLIACYCVEIHRADAVTRTTSRRWRGASEI